MKTTLRQLMFYENTLDDRLNMLTEIGLTTSNQELFRATEEIRHELITNQNTQEGRQGVLMGDLLYPDTQEASEMLLSDRSDAEVPYACEGAV